MLFTQTRLAAERSTCLLTSQAARRSYSTPIYYRSSAAALLSRRISPHSSRITVIGRNAASVLIQSQNSRRMYASSSTPRLSRHSSASQLPKYSLQELESMTIADLRTLLKEAGLKSAGRKKDLVKRANNLISQHHGTAGIESVATPTAEQAVKHANGSSSNASVKAGSEDAAVIAKEQQRLKDAQRLEQHEEEFRLREQQEKEAKVKERQEKERQLKEQQEKERKLKEQQEKERQLKEQQEKEHQLKKQQEKERQLKQQQEKERQLKEQQEKERQLKKQQEKERQLKEQQEKERQLKEQQEKEHQLKVQQEKERQLKEQQEKERQLKEQQEKERRLKEQQEKERQLKEQQEKERQLKEQQEKERQLKKQQEKEHQLKVQQEKERQLKEQQEKERQLKEQQEKEHQLKLQHEQELRRQQEAKATEAALKKRQSPDPSEQSTSTATSAYNKERSDKKADGEPSNDQWTNEKIPLGTKVSAATLGIGVVAWFLAGKRDRKTRLTQEPPAQETVDKNKVTEI
ncbi:hypothetical protein BGX27_006178 [Mortierella sp. AM989]|nr:hypothetical protein BGX27_006178 [Mortierella sp. AM989]